MSLAPLKRALAHPVVEAILLAIVALVCLVYGAPDPIGLYGRF